MAISDNTKQEFRQALAEEFDVVLGPNEVELLLKDLVGYYRQLQKLSKQIEDRPEPTEVGS